MKKNTLAKGGAALAGALLLAGVGGAPAFAANNTTGHADVVAIDSSGAAGTLTDANGFSPWSDPGFDESFTFNTAGNADVTCANGIITIPNKWSIESVLPFVGFENDTASDSYTISLEVASANQSVTFDAGSQSLVSGGSDLTLAPGTHQHAKIVFDTGATSCTSVNKTFDLEFSAQKTTGGAVQTQNIAFTVKR